MRELSLILPARRLADRPHRHRRSRVRRRSRVAKAATCAAAIAGPALELNGCATGPGGGGRFRRRPSRTSTGSPGWGSNRPNSLPGIEGRRDQWRRRDRRRPTDCRTRGSSRSSRSSSPSTRRPVPIIAEGEAKLPRPPRKPAEATSSEAESSESEARKGNEMQLEQPGHRRDGLAVVAIAVAFWVLAPQPEARGSQQARRHRSRMQANRFPCIAPKSAEAWRRGKGLPDEYQQLVVLGKAVPADDDTASLLVQLNRIADHAQVRFEKSSWRASGAKGPPTEAPAPDASAEGAPNRPRRPRSRPRLLPLGAIDRPRRPGGDALHAHLHRQLLPRRRLHPRASTRWSRRRTRRSTSTAV